MQLRSLNADWLGRESPQNFGSAQAPVGLLTLLGLVAFPVWSQEPQATFTSETRLMQIEVHASYRDGQPVRDLEAEDFEIKENGRPHRIAFFEFVPELPRLPTLSVDSETTAPAAEHEPEAAPLREPVWVYISTEAATQDYTNVHGAIETFLREKIREGMKVSLEGLPFTDDREKLLEWLDAMRESPFGRPRGRFGQWLPSLIDATAQNRTSAERLRELATDPRWEPDVAPTQARSAEELRRVAAFDEELQFHGRVAIFRYMDLIREMSVLPGKKAVIVFRGGLRLASGSDLVNYHLMDQLAGESIRHRVTFHTVDSRGLDAPYPALDSTNERLFERLRGPVGYRGGRPPLTEERAQSFRDTQHGLWLLAERTGGQATLNSNDLSLVFDDLAEDSGGYYLLGYYPQDPTENGHLRRVAVSVERPGVRLSYDHSYYEPRPFGDLSAAEKELHLHRALQFDTPKQIDLRFDADFFQGPDGEPVMIYSTGVRPSEVTTKRERGEYVVELRLAARALDPKRDNPETYNEQRLRQRYDAQAYEEVLADPHTFLRRASLVDLEPGKYDWKIVVRDERDGDVGWFGAEIDVPAFDKPLAASTMLIARQAAPLNEIRPTGEDRAGQELLRELLSFESSSLTPESPHVYRQGELVFLLYDLYNVPDEFLAAPPPAQVALMKGGEKKEQPPASWKVRAFPIERRLRYLMQLDTGDLETGEYAVFALMPDHQERADPYIYRTFQLIENRAE